MSGSDAPRQPLDAFLDRWFKQEGGDGPDARLRVARAFSLPGPWTRARVKATLRSLLSWDGESAERCNRLFEQCFPPGEIPARARAIFEDPSRWQPALVMAALETLPLLTELEEPLLKLPPATQASKRDSSGTTDEDARTDEQPSESRARADSGGSADSSARAGASARRKGGSATVYHWPSARLWQRGVLLLVLLLALGLGWWSAQSPDEQPTLPPSSATPAPPSAPSPTPSPVLESVTVPVPEIEPSTSLPPPAPTWPGWSLLAASALLLTFGLWLWREKHVPKLPKLDFDKQEANPDLPFQDEPPPSPWPPAMLDRLAFAVGVTDDEALPRLDIDATVNATLQAGGLLEPRFRPSRKVAELRWVVCADLHADPVAEFHLRTLEQGLRQRGVALLYVEPETPPVDGLRTLVFLDGSQAHFLRQVPWMTPDSAFIELRSPRLWGAELHRYPRGIFGLEPEALLQAMEAATQDRVLPPPMPTRSGGHRERGAELLPLEGVCAWAASLAPVSYAFLDTLRRRFFPETAPLDLQWVGRAPGVVMSRTDWSFLPERVSALAQRLSPRLKQEVLGLQQARVEKLKLTPRSWSWQVQQRLLGLMKLISALHDGASERELRHLLRALPALEAQLSDPRLARGLQAQTRGMARLLDDGPRGFSEALCHRLGRLGLGKPLARPGASRWQKGALALIAVWVLGSLGAYLKLDLAATPSPQALTVEVQGELAFAISWWTEDGPFDPSRATLAAVTDVAAQAKGADLSDSEYQAVIPTGARLVRVYALTRGGLAYRDVGLGDAGPQRVRISAKEKLSPISAVLELNGEGRPVRTIHRSSKPAKRPPNHPDGSLWVNLLSAPLATQYDDAALSYLEPRAVDFILREDSAALPYRTQTQVAVAAARTVFVHQLEEVGFICPGGTSDCVQGTRMLPDEPEVPFLQVESLFKFDETPTPAPEPTPSPAPTPVPLSPTPTPGAHPTARPILPTPAPATPPPPTPTEAPNTPTPPSATPTTAPGTPTPPKEPPVSITWLSIPGTGPDGFMMGSPDKEGSDDEHPRHKVTIPAFQLSKTEVTVTQYRACVQAKGKGCTEPDTGGYCNWGKPDRDNHPINCIDWNQAKAFAAWAGARLPSEAEWEYAARGKEGRKYPWGNTPEPSCDVVVMWSGSKNGCGEDRTWPVCSKSKGNTPTGLCDMGGNVWEWVEDCYEGNYTDAPSDGTYRTVCSGSLRVLRGGSWDFDASDLRGAIRDWFWPSNRFDYVGFRVAWPASRGAAP